MKNKDCTKRWNKKKYPSYNHSQKHKYSGKCILKRKHIAIICFHQLTVPSYPSKLTSQLYVFISIQLIRINKV